LPANTYDAVYSVGLLEHFEDPAPVIQESLRILKPGGLMFHVIVPAVPNSRAYFAKALLAPWRLLGTLAKQRLVPPDQRDRIYRTDHPRERYVAWAREVGARDISCVPYNPYHRVYGSAVLERWIALPTYGAHRALKQRLRGVGHAALRTRPEVALCDLLVAYK
jgi:SAM-dependent methyltransferase